MTLLVDPAFVGVAASSWLVLLAVVAFLIVAWVLLRRRSHPSTDIRRDSSGLDVAEPLRLRLGTRLGGLFGRSVDPAFWASLEEGLIAADLGPAAATEVVNRVRAGEPKDPQEARAAVRATLVEAFGVRDRDVVVTGDPAVIVVVGVNGSGKTTTVAKLAARYARTGSEALVAAADTFRAAAAEQMIVWGDRVGFEVVRGSEGADPAAVAFDALSAARARGKKVLIVDTAGRLHSKQNLMDELSKVVRVLRREAPISETLLVLDGSVGQNAIAQARAFTDAVGVSGIAITKLDGSAKGGVALAVERELGIPLKLIGVGEGVEDLLHFDPAAFVDELLGVE